MYPNLKPGLVDISAFVPDLSSYVFTPTSGTCVINGYFKDLYGLMLGTTFSVTLTASSINTFTTVSSGLGITNFSNVAGVVFDSTSNISYITTTATGITFPTLVKGPTWEAKKSRAVGRNGFPLG